MTEVAKHKATRSEPTLTPECRIAYPFIHERRTKDGTGKLLDFPRHDATVLVPKLNADPAQCANYQMLAKHCMDACVAQPGWGGFPQGGHWPIKDGDAPPTARAPAPGQAPKAAKDYPWRKGHWVIEIGSGSEIGPRVCVMQAGQAVEIPARTVAGKVMYKSGDYCHVSLHAYTFHNKTWGVKFGFEGVLFTRPGEAIGGGGGPREASAMFGGIAPVASGPVPLGPPGVAPTAAAPTPQSYAPPVPAAPAAPVPGYAPPAPPMAPAAQPYAPPLPPAAPVAAPPAPPPGIPPFPGAR